MAPTGPGQAQRIDDYEPSAGGVIYLRGLSRWQAEDQREEIADLYVESSPVTAGDEYDSRAAFLHRLTEDVRRPGFDMLIAEATVSGEAPVLVGAVFGCPVARDGGWWQGFRGTLPPHIDQLTASGHVFAITDVVVHRAERDRGLAGRLQHRLITDHQSSLGVTTVPASNRAVLAAFQGWGWQDVGEIVRPPREFDDTPPVTLRALSFPLPEPSPAV
ncbi:hypothetical protein OG565_31360 [Streptomyces sp. NBC_00138]